MVFNMTDFTKFLNAHRVTGDNDYNYVCLGGLSPAGKFNITDNEDIKTFYNYINQAATNKKYLSFAEVVPDICPLYVDLDFEAETINISHMMETTNKIIEIFKNEIKNNYIIDDIKYTLFTKDKTIKKDDNEKNGIHIIFNNVVIDKKNHQHIFHLLFLHIHY